MKFSKKKLFYIFIAILAVPILGLTWLLYLSPGARDAHKNVKNSKEVQIGFSREEMVSIMGPPLKIQTKVVSQEADSIYYYYPGFAAAGGIIFCVKNDTILNMELNE